jgi:hypothetical protein
MSPKTQTFEMSTDSNFQGVPVTVPFLEFQTSELLANGTMDVLTHALF